MTSPFCWAISRSLSLLQMTHAMYMTRRLEDDLYAQFPSQSHLLQAWIHTPYTVPPCSRCGAPLRLLLQTFDPVEGCCLLRPETPSSAYSCSQSLQSWSASSIYSYVTRAIAATPLGPTPSVPGLSSLTVTQMVCAARPASCGRRGPDAPSAGSSSNSAASTCTAYY